jgi:hypothetical protein
MYKMTLNDKSWAYKRRYKTIDYEMETLMAGLRIYHIPTLHTPPLNTVLLIKVRLLTLPYHRASSKQSYEENVIIIKISASWTAIARRLRIMGVYPYRTTKKVAFIYVT